MNRLLVLVTTLILANSLLSGCKATVQTYTDAGRVIPMGLGKQFVIALGSDPAAGYGWQVSYDESMLKLVAKTYEPSIHPPDILGAGGVEFFRFETLKTGETMIIMFYRRPWDKQSIDQKLFTVIIE